MEKAPQQTLAELASRTTDHARAKRLETLGWFLLLVVTFGGTVGGLQVLAGLLAFAALAMVVAVVARIARRTP